MTHEKSYAPMSGWVGLLLLFVLIGVGGGLFILGVAKEDPVLIVPGLLAAVPAFIIMFGFMAIAPNDSRVLLLFGEYKGTVKTSGFYWVNPFFSKKHLSLRVRNFETGSTSIP